MSKSPSLRRIQADIRELAHDPSDRYYAAPLEDDMFEWHFTIRGADQTEFEGGIYHGRILLPPEYPFKPPHIMFLTPSGRFETGTKVCLSFSAYHPELWQPAWGIRLILEALISFMPAPADGAIGALDWTADERKRLAKKSVDFVCPKCGKIADLLPELGSMKTSSGRFHKEIEKLHALQKLNEIKSKEKDAGDENESNNSTLTNLEDAITPREDRTNSGNDEETEKAGKSTLLIANNENKNDLSNDDGGNNILSSQNVIIHHELNEVHTNDDFYPSWILDPLLNGSIIISAVVVFLLYRQVDSLLDELNELRDA